MSIGHRLEDEELSDVSLLDLYLVMGEYTTARMLEKPLRLISGGIRSRLL
jgi:hypothetical protein